MMQINLLIPEVRTISLEELAALLEEPQTGREPFSDDLIQFCAFLSQSIFRDKEAAGFPELAALAFWMRKAELLRLRASFLAETAPETIAAPRGVVFHIPPGNVDTIFLYSWLLAALTGNRNVIRMSSRDTQPSRILLRLWRDALQSMPHLRWNTLVLSYGHEEEINRALSLLCDIRVVWGGDRTVSNIRELPLQPHAKEITFPDRYSMSALSAQRYLELSDVHAGKLAQDFFNDAFWFDQMACSSPETVIWCGDDVAVHRASDRFWSALSACADSKGHQSAPAIHMRKLVFAAESIVDLPVTGYRRDRHASVLTFDSLGALRRERCGGGLFLTVGIERLSELTSLTVRKDQTLTYFGFTDTEIREFVRGLRGRSFDRVVPIGQALNFGRFWDGYDLLHEFCRYTFVMATAGSV